MITTKDARYVANLANLAVTEEEITKYTQDLNGILEHIDKLNSLDTTGVAPMAQVLYAAEETATLREDEPAACLPNEAAVANAPLASGGYFKVPKVIER